MTRPDSRRPGQRSTPRITAAVLGRPIAHSKSPLLHTAAFQALGLDDSEYGRFDLGVDELEGFLENHPDYTGFSVTMPLKERLVEIARTHGWSIDAAARLTGAGNTVIRRDRSTLVANTDVQGIVAAIGGPARIRMGHSGLARAIILGAGATALSAIVACHEIGITTIELLVRNPQRARRALDLCARLGILASVAPLTFVSPAEVFISTLPAEAGPGVEISPEITSGVALDVAYATSSRFLVLAAAQGITPVAGTTMLIEQAVAQFGHFLAAASQRAEGTVDDARVDDARVDADAKATAVHAMYSVLGSSQ